MPALRRRVLSSFSNPGGSLEHFPAMRTDIAVMRCIAEAERRVDAMQILCEMLTGQIKGERRRLEELQSVIASTGGHEQSGQVAPGDIDATMLEG